MKVAKVKKLMMSGISAITNNANEMDENTAKIPSLWNDYLENNAYNKTFNRATSGYLYGVYTDYESDVNGDFKITIACEVTKPKNAIVVENQRYLVFTKKGEIPNSVIEAWEEIWEYFADEDSEYKRAYTIDFEKYLSEEEVEVYISIH